METVVESLVRAFYETLWNRWDDAAVEDLLAEDFVFRGSLGTRTRGRQEWRGYRDAIRAGSPDFRNEIVTLVVEGERAAARLRYTGTHSGPLGGMAPTGRRFAYSGCCVLPGRRGPAHVRLGPRRPCGPAHPAGVAHERVERHSS